MKKNGDGWSSSITWKLIYYGWEMNVHGQNWSLVMLVMVMLTMTSYMAPSQVSINDVKVKTLSKPTYN
jgi:hypothetical protein